MLLKNILPFTHYLLREKIRSGDTVLDGTAGNGHDTLLLAQCVGKEGKVWAFDVQQQALDTTAGRLKEAGVRERVNLVLGGHETLADYVCGPLSAAVFNFGWLPNSDKSCTTQTDTSIRALQAALDLLQNGGLLLAVLYPGHEEGRHEAEAVERWAAELPQHRFAVLKYGFVNRRNRPPYLLAVEKLRE
ncbi:MULTISPECIES: class I SAM-dependent methyltransferase [unclassified Neisseria]|uniref:class I SAM-dependent methyltransferase n=1 Tax=unclassified Neisseria TaxID=2623750 RepID=UPI00266587C7|nr:MULTISPECIES: class I SAM-dependent methyltransferase [unclassified Neisseria]MDO1509087.1 class I SAM-dependent methyltransferase [Neisseria sp. MVDL19-042950]MDO1516818.1 class I SAM-dependent methyltransferase [Neisseria sp. MVDL18-041461]MDO1563970.1 class I SAM-dependent methyltransferase [Neisseria sp. MVDL20-010259]